MSLRILSIALLCQAVTAFAQAPSSNRADTTAEITQLSRIYLGWRQAVMNRNARQWERLTATHRRMEVRNRLLSEKRPFPAGVFNLPAPPPKLEGLRAIHYSKKGPTAKLAFFGKVDFGIGGDPADNVLLLAFVNEQGNWKYDKADFVNLTALPDVRKELAAKDLSYIKETPEFQATGVVPQAAAPVPPAKYIAKVYAFCPGREINVQVNRLSRHRFANAKEAEIVVGGARDGRNEVSYQVKKLEGGTGKEAMTIRVYLMSQIDGTKPIKIFEYQVEEGQAVKPNGSGNFVVDASTAAKLVR